MEGVVKVGLIGENARGKFRVIERKLVSDGRILFSWTACEIVLHPWAKHAP